MVVAILLITRAEAVALSKNRSPLYCSPRLRAQATAIGSEVAKDDVELNEPLLSNCTRCASLEYEASPAIG